MEGKSNIEIAIGKLMGVSGILCSLSVAPEGIVKHPSWAMGLLDDEIDEVIEILENLLETKEEE